MARHCIGKLEMTYLIFSMIMFPGYFLHGTYKTIDQFMQRDVTQVVHREREVPKIFPAVTLCNMNPFPQSELDAIGFCVPQALDNKVLVELRR